VGVGAVQVFFFLGLCCGGYGTIEVVGGCGHFFLCRLQLAVCSVGWRLSVVGLHFSYNSFIWFYSGFIEEEMFYLEFFSARPRMCHSCVHLRAENIRLTAEVAALRASTPVREMRALLAEQVREFRFSSLQSHFLVARSELANCRQAMSYLMTALSSSDGERSALRGIVARCECAAKPGGAETAAPGLVAAESMAAGSGWWFCGGACRG